MDFTYRPNVLNAKFIRSLGGEGTFTITGAEVYTTQDGKELECLRLKDPDGQDILFNPNAGHKYALNQAGLRKSEEMIGYRFVLHLQKVQVGGQEVDGVRIKDILKPKTQEQYML